MKIIKLFTFFQTFIQILTAQNLVSDSSFEHNKYIPVNYSAIDASTSWNSPTRGTTDLFCKCNKKQEKISSVNVPQNAMGIQEAHTGKCYAGVFACSHGFYREYLQTSLTTPLQKNIEYELTMYVSLSDYSPLAVDKLGVCFLNGKIKFDYSEAITELQPVYIPIEDEIGMDVNDWHEIKVHYKAKGGENTIIIGSFALSRLWKTGNSPPPQTSTPIYKKMPRDAYYYFDDISIRQYIPEDTMEIPDIFPLTKVKVDTVKSEMMSPEIINPISSGELQVFNKVLFSTGESILSPSSYPELNIVAAYLKADRKLKIEIYGHTDNVGDEKKNKELSFDRAKAVADYLILKGVKDYNINYEGFGGLKPIQSNDTEEGRKNNRRVEFILKK